MYEDFSHVGPQHKLRVSAIEKAVAAERERCAKICETHAVYYVGTGPTKLVPSKSGEPIGLLFAAAIRNKE